MTEEEFLQLQKTPGTRTPLEQRLVAALTAKFGPT